MNDDPAFYDRAIERIGWGARVLGGAAVLLFLVKEGWLSALSCAVAAAASIYNLSRLKRMTAGLVNTQRPGSSGSAVLAGLRFVLIGGACIVVITQFKISALAVFAGLLTPVAAVMIEMLYQLLTATAAEK